jgi:hypothetical protein
MSTSSTEGGSQGQESGTATQGTGQESTQGVQGGQGQESGTQGNQAQDGQFDFSTIQDPAMRAWAEKVDKDAREARAEAARYRTERNQAVTQAQTLQQQNETDQERQQREANERQQRLEALEQENRTLKVGTAIQKAATDAKAFNPALIASMLDARVTLDDQGNPTNLQDLLRDLRQSDPYLFKRADANGGDGGGSENQPTGSMNDVIRGAVAARRGRTS